MAYLVKRLIISAQKKKLKTSLTQLKRALESVGDDYRESLFIVFQELIINSICEMESLGLENESIVLDWLESGDRIEGSLSDLGRGLNNNNSCPEDILSDLENESGRGLAIVKMLTDTFEVIPLEDRGFKYIFAIKKK